MSPHPNSVRSKGLAWLALVLTLVGTLQVSGARGLSGPLLDGAGCQDACGCPPAAAQASCCCDADETPGGGSVLAQLVDGVGCTPPAPEAVPASPAGPLLAEWSEVSVSLDVDASSPRSAAPRAPAGRAPRPPVPPPRA